MTCRHNTPLLICCLLAVSACQSPGPGDYANRGDPERLLTTTAEIMYIDLAPAGALDQLTDAIEQDAPARAILNCHVDKSACKKAKRILDKHHIASENTGAGNDVTLIYEHVIARDCEQRYIDNSSNIYNLHAKSFGCSITGNMVQMVTDKRQFTDPGLLGYRDGETAAQVYENYSKPSAGSSSSEDGNSGIGNSIIGSSGSSSSQ